MPTTGQCLISYFALVLAVCLAKDAHTVGKWAEKLGTELWDLAKEVGRPDELLEKYKSMNTRVEDKSGEDLVNVISENVGRMLRRKMDAVKCIRMKAEEIAEDWDSSFVDDNFTYFSSKSKYDEDDSSANKYREMELTSDSHFYNIPVNTSYSSVHIPTNVYHLAQKVKEDITRSEPLDDIFRRNYESDPALSWQYFGSVTGMLRQYPAMEWRMSVIENYKNPPADMYDCRLRSWFIEAATCSKDMVILMDTSGSMKGMGQIIAKTTVSSILDTLSNNDFVTLLRYSNDTSEMVPCFKDMLIQATPENIDTLKKSMDKVKTDGVANLTAAFDAAFSLLKTYRETRGCEADMSCNQLIMLVTDGVPGNLTEVFQKWNRKENNTRIPVRVFTYLLGREVTKVREIQWMACLNRGYYRHVQTQEEVREQVLKYIPVVARPLVLQGVVHPIVWTHVYADVTSLALTAWLWVVMKEEEQNSRLQKHLKGKGLGVRVKEDAIYIKKLDEGENIEEDPSTLNTTKWQEYRLLISVGTPVFDRKGNRNNERRAANLLGVAGTDVPIEDIRKLTLPYKLGVNGYAFIVSNNGYVILHPDLRPVYQGLLKLNYNSIDLTEVEILDDNRGPRNPGSKILELRSALVDHKRGSARGIPVKLHYDDNRRVALEKRDYFYAPLPGTPFSLAVAISHYGTTWIKVGDEIRRNQHMNVNVSDFFKGDHWRVHPSWVYCRYHYLEGHRFDSPEDELRHFLALLGRAEWRWAEQYEAYPSANENDGEDSDGADCGRKTLSHDDYYCNKELMQLLVFDAKATNDSFRGDYVEGLPARARDLARLYGVFSRFIATQSGLTRWHQLRTDELSVADDRIVFGDLYKRAVNEPWYKGAILQNELDPNSIYLSVPWEAGADAVVTASTSLSPKDGGKKVPAAVVGFQMLMTDLYGRFIALTSKTANSRMNCSHVWIDCYLLDQNGYVVISEAHNDTGQFMGTQEGAVMKSMVLQGLYDSVDIYDYQAWCRETRVRNSASGLMEPLRYVWRLLLGLALRLAWFSAQFANLPGIHGKVHSDEDAPDPPPPPKSYLHHYACDQKRTLYILNETVAAKGVTNHSDYCSRPYHAQRVAHTNLLLVVVDSMYPTCYRRLEITPVNMDPTEYANGTAEKPCRKIPLHTLKRRRLESCFTEHPLEYEIDDCGGASGLTMSVTLLRLLVARILLAIL